MQARCHACCRMHSGECTRAVLMLPVLVLSTLLRWSSFLQVFLISTKAGSVGINLVSARRLVLYDLP